MYVNLSDEKISPKEIPSDTLGSMVISDHTINKAFLYLKG